MQRDSIKKILITACLVLALVTIAVSMYRQRLHYLLALSHKKYHDGSLHHQFHYGIYVYNIPFGHVDLKIERDSYQNQDVNKIHFSVLPPFILRVLSFDNLGMDLLSLSDKNNLLPYYFEQNSIYKKKKNQEGRKINYVHPELLMLRGDSKEDILDDTRDPLSFIVWLMSQDYEHKDLIKTTLNIKRKTYLVIGKVKERNSQPLGNNTSQLIRLKLNVLQIDRGYRIIASVPIEVYLMKTGAVYVPLLFNVKIGWFHVTLAMR